MLLKDTNGGAHLRSHWLQTLMTFYPRVCTGLLLFLSFSLGSPLAGCRVRQPKLLSASSTPFADASSPIPPPQIVAPPVAGLIATLEDEVRDLPDGRIAWTTYWNLCWESYAGAQKYELEPMTGEGTGRRLLRQAGPCLRIEVAKGQNVKAQGFFNRELMLASLSGQMSYRVRAVLSGGNVSQWSTPAIVGQGGKPDSTPLPRRKQK